MDNSSSYTIPNSSSYTIPYPYIPQNVNTFVNTNLYDSVPCVPCVDYNLTPRWFEPFASIPTPETISDLSETVKPNPNELVTETQAFIAQEDEAKRFELFQALVADMADACGFEVTRNYGWVIVDPPAVKGLTPDAVETDQSSWYVTQDELSMDGPVTVNLKYEGIVRDMLVDDAEGPLMPWVSQASGPALDIDMIDDLLRRQFLMGLREGWSPSLAEQASCVDIPIDIHIDLDSKPQELRKPQPRFGWHGQAPTAEVTEEAAFPIGAKVRNRYAPEMEGVVIPKDADAPGVSDGDPYVHIKVTSRGVGYTVGYRGYWNESQLEVIG